MPANEEVDSTTWQPRKRDSQIGVYYYIVNKVCCSSYAVGMQVFNLWIIVEKQMLTHLVLELFLQF